MVEDNTVDCVDCMHLCVCECGRQWQEELDALCSLIVSLKSWGGYSRSETCYYTCVYCNI